MFKRIKNITIPSPHEVIKNFYNTFSKTDKFAFASSFIIWMIAHLFVFTNDFFVYDSVRIFDTSNGLNNGRFLVYPILLLFSNFQMPLVAGIFSGIIIAASIILMCRILKVTRPIYILLLAATVTTFPVLYNTNAFLSSVQVFALALFFSTLAAYFAKKDSLIGYLLSALFIFFSLACYQAYMPFAVCLFLLSVLIDALENKKVSELIKKVAITGIVFIVAIVIYYLVWQFLMNIFNVVPSEYRGESITISSMLSLDTFARIIKAYVLGVLISFKGLFYRGNLPLMAVGRFVKFCIPLLATLLMFVFIKSKKTKFGNIIMSCIAFLALPLGIGLIYVFSPFSPHTLMLFPSITLYLMVIALSEKLLNDKKTLYRVLEWIIVILLVISILLNVILGNAAYSILSSESKSAISFATRIVDRIESTNGVEVGTKVCFVSDEYWFYSVRDAESNENTDDILSSNEESTVTQSFNSFTVISLLGTPYVDALIWYINDNANYLELEYSYQDLQNGEYADNPQVQALESFPAKNCSVWVNDTLIVKI